MARGKVPNRNVSLVTDVFSVRIVVKIPRWCNNWENNLFPTLTREDEVVTGEQILIVEHDPVIARMLGTILKSLGYSVSDTVDNALDAIVYSTVSHPDIVLIDTDVPGPVDGIGIACYLTQMFSIPVILVSGDQSGQTIERAKKGRPLGYLVKPVGKIQMYSTMEIALNLAAVLKKPREENQLRDSLQGLLAGDDGIICLDREERVLMMNSVAEFITGTAVRQAFLSPARDILSFPDGIASSLFADSLVQASRGTASIGKMKDFLVRSKDRSTKSVSINVLPVRERGSEIIGIVIQLVFSRSSTMQSLTQKHAAA